MKKFSILIIVFTLFFTYGCNDQEQPPRSGFIRAGNLQVYYEREGKGDPILLLHAGLQDHTMWEEQVKAFSSQYDVITPDLPFHGKTTGVDTTVLAQDVIRILLDSLKIEKVFIAGLSMGASVTQDFIIAYPQRVNKAILISSGITGYDKVQPLDSLSINLYVQFAKALEEKDTARAATEFTKAWAEGVYRSGDSLKAPVSKYTYQKTLETLKNHTMAGWPKLQTNPPAYESLPGIKVPVLIIDGDKDLPYVGKSCDHMAKTIPGAKRIQIKDVAHMLNLEKPEAFNKIVEDFLKGN